MSSPSDTTKACERYERLRRREAEAGLTEAAERRFLHEHGAGCPDCRALRTVLETIQWSDDATPNVALDELSRRRLINDAVAQVDAAPAQVDRAPQPKPASPARPDRSSSRPVPARSWRRYGAIAAGIAAVIVLAVLWSPWRRDPARELALPTPTVAPPSARYLLLAGAVRTNTGSAALNGGLHFGQWVETNPIGSAVLRLPCGATVLLAGKTRLRLARAGLTEVALRRGALLALVDPQRPGARFAVVTKHGRVEVKGTVFQVTTDPTGSHAAVLRGRVQVNGTNRPPVQVLAGQQVVVGAERATALSPATSQQLWQQVRLLDLLQTDRPATLVVTSRPVGAQVMVDGVTLGNTPLVVSLRPGHRRLELSAKGYGAVREHVLLKALHKTSRDFELKPAKLTVLDPSSTAGRGPRGSGAPAAPASDVRSLSKKSNHGTPATPPQDLRRALLNRAQLLRAARDWWGAAGAYRELIRRYPSTAEAATALVSLGVLQLRHLGQPAEALRAFQRYLKGRRRGALAREAAYGRILALRALGRRAPEIQALRAFLKRYPRALRAGKVKRRLEKITSSAGTPRRQPAPGGRP